MIKIFTENKVIYYCYCPCQENIRKLRCPKKMWNWKAVYLKFYEEQFSYVLFPLGLFGQMVETKTVKVTYVSIFPVQDGKKLFLEIFRGLVEYATAKQGIWDCAALSWRLTSDFPGFFSFKTPSSLFPGFLILPKIFLYYIEITVKSLHSAAMR